MSPRNAAARDLLYRRIGVDLAVSYAGAAGRFEDADLTTVPTSGVPPLGDVGTVSAINAAVQMLANRLKTQRGELAALGHPDYGSRHHDLIGQPNTPRVRNLMKLYVLEALGQEPRIQRVLDVTVSADHDPPRETVRIEVSLLLIEIDQPLDLVVPFSLGIGG